MSTLNQKGTGPKRKTAVSFNGNVQLAKADEQQLYEALVMTMWGKDTAYESNDTRLARIRECLASVVKRGNLDFVANAIVYARTVMNIRTFPIIIAVEFASELRKQGKEYANMRRVITDVIQRADQITDMYAYALSVFGEKGKVPMAIRRGVADAFNKFNEYQFAKYNRAKAVKLRDVLRIVHPTGKDEAQGELFAKIMKDELKTPYTWETQLSANGQLPANEKLSNKALWTNILKATEINTKGHEVPSIGYMALLRNLRNILEAGVDHKVLNDYVCARLADPKEVARSKQLPFSFVNAIDALGTIANVSVREAVEEALDLSLANLPKLGDNVWIIVDCSGSMSGTPIRTASLFASALYMAQKGAENVAVTMFSDNAFHVHQSISRKSSVMANTNKLMSKVTGGGTNLQAALNMRPNLGFEPDTVIVLSDMQVNLLTGSGYSYYRNSPKTVSEFGPDVLKVAINLNAYESTPCAVEDGWYQLGGFSEKLFDFIPAMRNKQSVTKILSQPYFGINGAKTLFADK